MNKKIIYIMTLLIMLSFVLTSMATPVGAPQVKGLKEKVHFPLYDAITVHTIPTHDQKEYGVNYVEADFQLKSRLMEEETFYLYAKAESFDKHPNRIKLVGMINTPDGEALPFEGILKIPSSVKFISEEPVTYPFHGVLTGDFQGGLLVLFPCPVESIS
ncbi:MAG: hypothetical protein JSV49_11440 [Thermoplasmata archaeon]|nr:MAG: hypothetical protein JSV49_11440 [Thermoplasmata archaeon]